MITDNLIYKDIIDQLEIIAQTNNNTSFMAKYTLRNIYLITKLTEEEFIINSFCSLSILKTFLACLGFNHYLDLCQAINAYLVKKIAVKTHGDNSNQILLQKIYSQLFNSLELNYETLTKQDNILTTIVEKIKGANRVYFFTNKHSLKIIEDFANNLIAAGFKINIVANHLLMNELINKVKDKDLIFFIFEDFKNKQLINVAKQLINYNHKIIISKINFHEINHLEGIKYAINYEQSGRSAILDTRKFSLMFLLNLIWQKIIETINFNYAQINFNAGKNYF